MADNELIQDRMDGYHDGQDMRPGSNFSLTKTMGFGCPYLQTYFFNSNRLLKLYIKAMFQRKSLFPGRLELIVLLMVDCIVKGYFTCPSEPVAVK
jgi:hypothetical protein